MSSNQTCDRCGVSADDGHCRCSDGMQFAPSRPAPDKPAPRVAETTNSQEDDVTAFVFLAVVFFGFLPFLFG